MLTPEKIFFAKKKYNIMKNYAIINKKLCKHHLKHVD